MANDRTHEQHRRQWHGFVKLVSWSLAAVVATLVLMAVFLL